MIYFCIPAYNEAGTIGLLLYRLREVMTGVGRDYHVFVLDDGSTDETNQIVEGYLRLLPLTALRLEENRGFGPSLDRLLREAYRAAAHPEQDVIITLQADFTHHPDTVPSMIRAVEEGADLVVATPFLDGERARGIPRRLLLFSHLVSLPLRIGYGLEGIRDYVSSCQAYRVSLIKKAIQLHQEGLITLRGAAASTELLLHLARAKPRCAEVPLHSRYDIRRRPSRLRLISALRDFSRLLSQPEDPEPRA